VSKTDDHKSNVSMLRKLIEFVFLVTVIVGSGSCTLGSDAGQNKVTNRNGVDTVSLGFSTYTGGSRNDQIRDVTTDIHGNIYITGGTESSNFPVTAGAYQTVHNPGRSDNSRISQYDVFVTRLDSNGNIIWSTLIGGPNYDRAYAIEVDNQGYIYVGGRAGRGFPVTRGAFQTTFMGGQEASSYGPQDGFVAKLTPNGRKLVWASYFGRSDPQIIRDLDIDQNGNVYVVSGYDPAYSPFFPPGWATWFSKGYQKKPQGGKDVVVARIASDGSDVVWATYLGGSSDESGAPTIRVDADGYSHVFMSTRSMNIPTTTGAYDRTYNGGWDAYVARLTPDGSTLVYGTYLGGSRNDGLGETHFGAVDAQGNAYVSGPTNSTDFPTTPGAVRRTGGATPRTWPPDYFSAKLSPDGSRLVASTYYGASEGVVVDSSGNVYFTGSTIRTSDPVSADAFQKTLKGVQDARVAKLSADFSKLLYATYMGGTNERRHGEGFRAIAIDSKGNIYAAGITEATDWPTLNAFQPSHAGNWDGVLAKFIFTRRPSNH